MRNDNARTRTPLPGYLAVLQSRWWLEVERTHPGVDPAVGLYRVSARYA